MSYFVVNHYNDTEAFSKKGDVGMPQFSALACAIYS